LCVLQHGVGYGERVDATSRAWDESAGIGRQAWRAAGWLALRSLMMAGSGVAAVALAGIILDTKALASWDLLIEQSSLEA